MLSNRTARTGLLAAALTAAHIGAYAFMPAPGVWIVDAESNGQPGRGFQIDVENEYMVFYYNGYRADGSSLFYVAIGQIQNNQFVAPLTEYKGGTPIGAAYRPATASGSPGNVGITFTNGTRGVVTFPGEAPKTISKLSFGYPATQDGLMGGYLFSYITTQLQLAGDFYLLTTKHNESSQYGNGLVSNSASTFACENITSTTLAGTITCVEVTNSANDNTYIFRMAGDRGTGVATWQSTTSYYPLQVTRMVLSSGQTTGLNEGDLSTLQKLSVYGEPARPAAQRNIEDIKAGQPQGDNATALSDAERDALRAWSTEAAALLRSKR